MQKRLEQREKEQTVVTYRNFCGMHNDRTERVRGRLPLEVHLVILVLILGSFTFLLGSRTFVMCVLPDVGTMPFVDAIMVVLMAPVMEVHVFPVFGVTSLGTKSLRFDRKLVRDRDRVFKIILVIPLPRGQRRQFQVDLVALYSEDSPILVVMPKVVIRDGNIILCIVIIDAPPPGLRSLYIRQIRIGVPREMR